jgi:hypothetical protein
MTRTICYLIYLIFYLGLTFGTISYAVFVLEYSGWWMVLAVILNYTTYSPSSWMTEEDD